MPAHNEDYPWEPYYGYDAIAKLLMKHSKVRNVMCLQDGLFLVNRALGDELRLFACECYCYGVAELHETLNSVGQVDVIFINSMWCSYTGDAKETGLQQRIGIFTYAELMGALHRSDIWRYVPKSERG